MFILFIGLFIRLGLAISVNGFLHPDEIFQILEPAYGLWKGPWLKSWEWHHGMRSYLPPLFISKIMNILSQCSTEHWYLLLKIALSLWSFLIPYWGSQLSKLILTPIYQCLFTAILSFWWIFLAYAHHPLSESLCAPLLVGHFYFFIMSITNINPPMKDRKKLFLLFISGMCLSVAFMIRPQTLLWGGGFCFFLIYDLIKNKKSLKEFLFFFLPYGSGILYFGLYDLFTKGILFSSLIQYTYWNLIKGVMNERFGSHPWYRYASTFWKTLTPPFFFFLCYVIFSIKKWNLKKNFLSPYLLWPLLTFFIFHTLLSHKEDRFLFPIWFFLFLFFMIIIQDFNQTKPHTSYWFLALIMLSFIFNVDKIRRHSWQAHQDIYNQSIWIQKQKQIQSLLVWGKPLGYASPFVWIDRPLLYKTWDQSKWEQEDFPYHLVLNPYAHLQLEKNASTIIKRLRYNYSIICSLLKAPFYECKKNIH